MTREQIARDLREMAEHLWDVEHRINIDDDAKTLLAAADVLALHQRAAAAPAVSADICTIIDHELDIEVDRDGLCHWTDVANAVAHIKAQVRSLTALERQAPRPLSEWSDDIGSVMWWRFPVEEPPYIGTPNDLGFSCVIDVAFRTSALSDDHTSEMKFMTGGWPGYHTHWTPLPDVPAAPPVIAEQREGE